MTGANSPYIETNPTELLNLARAVLARFAQPTLTPIPVSERPWEQGNWCNKDGECWWCPPDGPVYWSMVEPAMVYGGWLLPADALPLPVAPGEGE
jgi:hypothetical protein